MVRLPFKDGEPTGEYEDFLVGFVADDASVWGRPVDVAVAHDGALLVTDDGGGVDLARRLCGALSAPPAIATRRIRRRVDAHSGAKSRPMLAKSIFV